ncbi:CbiX/SirB N-terminal domain-containing protein [Enterococcus termitis]
MAHGTKQTDEPQQALLEIAAEIQQQVDFPVTAVSLKGKEDYVEIINDGLSKDKQPVIVPFFLFDGHLITIMNTKLAEAFPEIDFIVTPTLEFDPRILPDIEAIVNEAVACIQ